MFSSSRYYTDIIGHERISYESMVVLNKELNEKDALDRIKDPDTQAALCYIFYTETSSYPKRLHGIDSGILNLETIELHKDYADLNLKALLDNPEWRGIILPSSMISDESIGKTMTLNIEGKAIDFVIEGGYHPNVFHQNIWYCSKSYLQNQLGKDQEINYIYSKLNLVELSELAEPLGIASSTSKDLFIADSIDKVVQSTEIIEITSIIIILCSLVSLISYLIMHSEATIRDIAKIRAAGVSVYRAMLIYVLHIGGIVGKGYIIGSILALLFSSLAVQSMFQITDIKKYMIVPYGLMALLFIMIILSLVATFVLTTRRAFRHDFIQILRNSTNS